jgi:hypothetical protein
VGPWDLEASLIPHDYVRAVEEAGGRPLLVPPSENGLEETLDALDRIAISGGSDLDPEHYGAEAHPETSGIHEERDRAELELMKAALEPTCRCSVSAACTVRKLGFAWTRPWSALESRNAIRAERPARGPLPGEGAEDERSGGATVEPGRAGNVGRFVSGWRGGRRRRYDGEGDGEDDAGGRGCRRDRGRSCAGYGRGDGAELSGDALRGTACRRPALEGAAAGGAMARLA